MHHLNLKSGGALSDELADGLYCCLWWLLDSWKPGYGVELKF